MQLLFRVHLKLVYNLFSFGHPVQEYNVQNRFQLRFPEVFLQVLYLHLKFFVFRMRCLLLKVFSQFHQVLLYFYLQQFFLLQLFFVLFPLQLYAFFLLRQLCLLLFFFFFFSYFFIFFFSSFYYFFFIFQTLCSCLLSS